MKFRTTLFFAALFIAAMGLYQFQTQKHDSQVEEIRKTSDDFKVQVEEKSFEVKSGNKINFIQVQNLLKDETFWLEKSADGWKVVFPVRCDADQSLAQGMEGMVKMALGQKLMRPEGGWEQYGLDKPEFKIGVGTDENQDRHFLYLGKPAPIGDALFARWDDKEAYFLLPEAVRQAFRKSIYDVREKRLFLTPVVKMDRIYVDIGDRTLDWALRGGTWYWMEPLSLLGKPVAQDQALALIQAVSRLFVKEFIEDADKSVYQAGITMISDRIQVKAGNATETVFLGNEEPLKTAYFASRENDRKIFLIDQSKVIELLGLLDALEKANIGKNISEVHSAAQQPSSSVTTG